MLETEITDKVKALTKQDWQELQYLYERVATHKGSFYTLGGGGRLPNGAITMPFAIEEPLVRDVRKFFYEKGLIVPFDWGRWDEGRAMFKKQGEDKFSNTNLTDVIKLFTAVIRNDRFCEGAFAELFEGGDALKLLKRLLDFSPATAKL